MFYVKKGITIGLTGLIICIITGIGFSIYMHFTTTENEVPMIFGYQTFRVLTGSMRPAIKAGDMIIIQEKNPEEVKPGDVITFRNKKYGFVTHRVKSSDVQDGVIEFETKGDANENVDRDLVLGNDVVGIVVGNIPKGAVVVDFFQSTVGLVLCIIFPAVVLLGLEIKTISSEKKREKISDEKNIQS